MNRISGMLDDIERNGTQQLEDIQASGPAVAGQASPVIGALGTDGYAGAPVQQSWRGPWGWRHGPHTIQAWPLIGALPQSSLSPGHAHADPANDDEATLQT
jgi:hypothetical protein